MAKSSNSVRHPLGMAIEYEVHGNGKASRLVCFVDLLNAGHPTKPALDKKTGELKKASGNRSVANTGGNQTILSGLKLSINVYDEIKGRAVVDASEWASMDGIEILKGTNVSGVITGTTLVITMDPGFDGGVTGGGKNRRVATSHGNVPIGNGFRCGVNLYDPIAR